jgi:predicted nucleotidyltransferase
MANATATSVAGLSDAVRRALDDFLDAAKRALGDDLAAAVLYGSGADGTMRASSDVNLILVLSSFDRSRLDSLREPLRFAAAAIRLKVMFLLETEVVTAVQAFAVKFADVLRRRRVLFGHDPFEAIVIPRAAMILRLRQVLLNLAIRLRESYMLRSLREEQLVQVIADSAGPLRTAAATVLEIEGKSGVAPKQALARVAAEVGVADHKAILARLSRAREERRLAPGEAPEEIVGLIALASALRRRAERLTP